VEVFEPASTWVIIIQLARSSLYSLGSDRTENTVSVAIAQQHLIYCLFILCCGNLLTEPLPSNERLLWFRYYGFQGSCHSINLWDVESCGAERQARKTTTIFIAVRTNFTDKQGSRAKNSLPCSSPVIASRRDAGRSSCSSGLANVWGGEAGWLAWGALAELAAVRLLVDLL
jgi:hypothetical protein